MRSAVSLFVLLLASGLSAAEKPNIIVFLADDQGWGDFSSNGNTNLATPNIDSIGEKGATLDNFYVCAVCGPTPAARERKQLLFEASRRMSRLSYRVLAPFVRPGLPKRFHR